MLKDIVGVADGVTLGSVETFDSVGVGVISVSEDKDAVGVGVIFSSRDTEGVAVGDVQDAGSFGDFMGGPTEINRDSDSAANELLNRLKFGIEGVAFTGAIGAAGQTLKRTVSYTHLRAHETKANIVFRGRR